MLLVLYLIVLTTAIILNFFLSHILDHVKGAFTGTDKEKEGIVEKADGGILFLDEIHRLPSEGQEMVFYFMDTGSI